MFIVNPNKGGFQGDVVNSGFRRGRQDAYRDYIDNFNFALKADAANNAENQLNVQRAANNYGLENQMRQGARTEAINFVNDASKLDNAVVGGEINFNKNNELWGQAKELGKAQGQEFIASQSANTNKAINTNTEQSYLADNPNLVQENVDAKYKAAGLNNQAREAQIAHSQAATEGVNLNNSATKNIQSTAQQLADATKQAEAYAPVHQQVVDSRNEAKAMTDENWKSLVLNGQIQHLKEQGDKRSDAEIAASLQADPARFNAEVQAYKQQQLANLDSQYEESLAKQNALLQAQRDAQVDNYAAQQGATSRSRTNGAGSRQTKQESPKEGTLRFDKKDEKAFYNYVTHSKGEFLDNDQTIGLVGNTVVYPSGRKVTYPASYTKQQILAELGIGSGEEENANSGNIIGN